jgi:hypothetical protein
MRASEFIVEVSDERLQSYLNQAGQQIDRRQTRMAQARERLNKGYEIYHAEDPTRTVHRFEANTPAEARRYYEKYNANYESDRDYDLKLRRSTGLMEDAFRGIDISMERDDDEIMIRASAGGKQLGSVLFVDSDGYLMPQDLEVNERYRGQGIAAAMYDYVKSQGYRIRRSGQQTDAGAGFWAKHRPDSNVWEQGVAEGTDDIKKTMSKLEALALAANRAGDDTKCKMYQQKIQSLKQKLSKDMSAGVTEVKIGPEITGRSLLFKAAAMAMRDAGREGITLDYDQAIKQASRIYGIPYQPSELPKLLAQRAEIDRQLALLKQGKQVAKQRRQEKRAPTPAGAEEYWRTHALPTDRIKPATKTLEAIEEDLKKWFKEKWVRFGPDGKIRGDCARGSSSEGKPKCLPQSKAQALGKKGRASSAAKKRREDPNPERRGAAKNVATKVKETLQNKSSDEIRRIQHMLNVKYDANLDVDGMLGPLTMKSIEKFLPKAQATSAPDPTRNTAVQGKELKLDEKQDACYNKVKSRYKVWPSAYASGALVQCRKKGAANWGNKGKKK